MIGNIGPWQLLILLVIVVLVFGTKRLRNLGGDLGTAVRGFRKGLNEDEEDQKPEEELSGGALGSDIPGNKADSTRQQSEATDRKD